ncbi:MAG: hypothetical protein AAB459_02455 [Patescibacteria group bacterium]
MNRRSGALLLLVAFLVTCSVSAALVIDVFFEKPEPHQKLMLQGMIGGACVIIMIILITGICSLLGISLKRDHD